MEEKSTTPTLEQQISWLQQLDAVADPFSYTILRPPQVRAILASLERLRTLDATE